MSRLSALAAHPRRTVGALAVVLAAVGITVGSGADFTAKAANPSNTFTAGTLAIGSSTSSALFNATNLKPGDTVSGTVDIQNTGSVPGTFKLSSSHITDLNNLLPELTLKVEDCGVFTGTDGATAPTCSGTNVLYNNKASALPSVSLGSFAANATHRHTSAGTMPSTLDNAFQGKTATVEFDGDATA